MYIDTHVHVWELDRGDYAWIKPDNPLFRDFLPDHLHPLLKAAGVQQVMLVQAAETVTETEYMLSLADQYAWIEAVMGGIHPLQTDYADNYARLKGHPGLRGLRFNSAIYRGSAGGPEGTVLNPAIVQAMKQLAADGYVLDLLVNPGDLPQIAPYVPLVPELTIVLNHLGGFGAALKAGQLAPWTDEIAALAAYPNVHCKLSGMITQAGGPHTEKVLPYAAHLFEVFGADRLMYGSDWPVATLGGSYPEVVSLFESLWPDSLSEVQKSAVRMDNARRIYGLPEVSA